MTADYSDKIEVKHDAPYKWRCECRHISRSDELLIIEVPHPKPGHPDVEVEQCPECGEINAFTAVCDEAGCQAEVTCGWPDLRTKEYRRTCGKHMDEGTKP